MRIKEEKKKKLNFIKNYINKSFFFKIYFFFTIFLFVIFTTIFFQIGIWEDKKKEFFKRIYANGIINYSHLPEIIYYKINSIIEKQKKISIEITQKNIIKIESNRKDILDFLKDQQKEFKYAVPFVEGSSFIINKNEIFKSDIRLKGDRRIHFEDRSNSSYRIDIKNDEVFNEMSKFSIQKPRIRNYLNEWIFHELLGDGGLVKLKYDFYDFYLNGKFLGFYNVEEGFGKVLLERNKRRNGPIFSLFESLEKFDLTTSQNKFEVYNKKYWEKEENLEITRSAIKKLNNFLEGKEDIEEVFDLEKWAWFFAVTDLTYTYHGTLFKSVKFYYNPINGKFEPIGFDGHRQTPNYNEEMLDLFNNIDRTNFSIAKNKVKNNINYSSSIEREFFFKNKDINYNFYSEYVKSIKKISSKEFLDNFFKSRANKIKKINSGIYSDKYKFDYDTERKSGVGIYYFSKKEIYRRAESLLQIFSLKKDTLFIEEDEENLIFNNYDYTNYFLANGKIFCNNNNIDITNFKIDKKILYLKKDDEFNYSCNKIFFEDIISGEKIEFVINKYNSFKKKSNINKNNYLKYFYLENKKVKLKNDFTTINENIYIPKGYVVLITAGQKILLKDSAFIFSNSNWIVGDLKKATFIGGTNENYGGGLIIYDNDKTSFFINCDFKYLNGLKLKTSKEANNFFSERLIYGSVNFFQTNVAIKNSRFKNINSEDGLNIVSSSYLLKNSIFKEIKQDAVDIDFSNGEIQNINFENIGNDAIDFSGSTSEISFLNFKNISDKAISVGENSILNISNISVKNSLVGIASKDGSKTYAKNIDFINVDYPFAAYQKKKAYDFGKLILNNFVIDNFKINFIRDINSIIFDEKLNKQLGTSNKKINKIIKSII
tara:strand:+ start:678 stop:3326 length:2649 start_codon:yes stop_codon:yes gene_type:complete